MYANACPHMPTPIHAVAVSGAILLLMQNMRVEQLKVLHVCGSLRSGGTVFAW